MSSTPWLFFIDSLPPGSSPLRGYVHLGPLPAGSIDSLPPGSSPFRVGLCRTAPAGSIQIFAGFGFAILYSTLVLYATKHLHLGVKEAAALMDVFG